MTQRRGDGPDKTRSIELAGGHIHRDEEVGPTGDFAPGNGLPGRFLEYEVAERDDEPRILGQRDEICGRDESPHRIPPANQRLGAERRAGRHVHNRLVEDVELVVIQSASDSGFGVKFRGGVLAEFGVKHLDPAPPVFLRLVHGDVGVLKEPVGRIVGSAEHDAETGTDVHIAPLNCERRLETGGDPGRHALDLRHGPFAQQNELVAAEPRKRVIGAHNPAQPLSHELHKEVAGCVTHGVIDELEAVQIEEYHANGCVASLRPGQSLGQTVVEQSAIREASQRVVQGAVFELDLHRLSRRDVLELGEEDRGLVLVVADERDIGECPNHRSVGPYVSPLIGEMVVAENERCRTVAPRAASSTWLNSIHWRPMRS